LTTAGVSLAIWRGLLSNTGPAASEAAISPSSRTVQVAGRPRSYGVHRADLQNCVTPRRAWDWKLCATSSPVSFHSWNSRQWYSPDPCLGLSLPEPSRSVWKPCSFSSGSRQNWYSPGYHRRGDEGDGSTSRGDSLRRQQHYYSTRVTHPRDYPSICLLNASINQML